MNLLWSYLKQYWKLLALALVLAAINQVFSLLDPLIFRHVIDEYAMRFDQLEAEAFYRGVLKLLGAAIGVAFVSRVAKNFQDYFVNVIVQKIGAQMYSDGLEHSLSLSYNQFEDQRSGETLGILQKVRTDVERLVSASINILFTTLVGVIFVVIYAINVHWLIAPMFFGSIPLLGFVSSSLSKRIKKMQKTIVSETTSLAGSTTESLRNIELVKSLGLADQEIKRLNNTTSKILGLELKKVKYIRSLSFIQGTTVNFIRTSILFMMLYLIFRQELTVGQFFSLMIYSFFIFGPLQELGNIINIYREAQVSLGNFENILKLPKEEKAAKPNAITSIDSLSFDNVSFKHQSAQTFALQHINFRVKSGETLAFVGPSGSGKTTLVKLLVGLYKPIEGNIFYNDINATQIDLDELRKKIGFVTQDPQLFAGTIKENLIFVNPQATDEACYKALEMAACQNLLERADKGIYTLIGEGGVKISGGEKQRLSIARALLRNPELLVFDEATSALDSITEEAISDTIRSIAQQKNHISILIAHRLSTIMHADKIFVLEKGKIIEIGSHQELLDKKGLYFAMWRQQIGERKTELVG
jgi:ATP-binding cassette, subfamily B, bacterial